MPSNNYDHVVYVCVMCLCDVCDICAPFHLVKQQARICAVNEVVSLCLNPKITEEKNMEKSNYFKESIKKAEIYKKQIKVGAYSCSKGIESVRRRIAERLSIRDNMVTDQDEIFLTYGGMDAYQHILSLFNRNESVNI